MSIQAITRAIPPIPGEESNVTNGSDSRSTTQDVVASATATSSDTQATSKKASRVRRCWNRMISVFCCNTSRADVGLTNNKVARIGSAVQNTSDLLSSSAQNKADLLSRDLLKIKGLVDLVSELKKSNTDPKTIQKRMSQSIRQNSIGCMSLAEVEPFADYICNTSQPDTRSSMRSLYLKMLLTDLDYSTGWTIEYEVYNLLSNSIKEELNFQVDSFISEGTSATETDQTLVEIQEQGLSDVEFIYKLTQVTKQVVSEYNRIMLYKDS